MGLLDVMLADGPTGLWPLDELSGTVAKDISGNGRDGAYAGTTYALGSAASIAPGAKAHGLSPYSADLQATAYVTLGGLAAWERMTSTFSVEIWTYQDTFSTAPAFITKWNGTNGWILQGNDGGSGARYLEGYAGAGLDFYSPSTAIPTGALLHLVMTWNKSGDGNARSYINGTQVGVGAIGSVTEATGTNLILGSRGSGSVSSQQVDGRIACAAFYPTVLTPDQVMKHYRAGLRGGVSY